MEGFDAATYGEAFADIYDDWYADVSDVGATVEAVEGWAEGRPVLELGVGTGRLARPLAARGMEVHGIDASPAMLAGLRELPGGEAVRTVLGDLSDVGVKAPGGFGVVLAVFNTIFNLASEEAQRRCFANAANRLAPGGAFVLEASVLDPDRPPTGVSPTRITADEVVLSVHRADAGDETVSGAMVSLGPGGVRVRPWHIRPVGPEDLDAMAAAAGLALAGRWAGWRREPFGPDSTGHVSLYRAPGP